MGLHFFIFANPNFNLHLRANGAMNSIMRKLFFLLFMLLSTCVFSQTMSESTFFKKHPNFGRTKLAFISELREMPITDKKDKKKVASLVKKHVKYYSDECYAVVKAEEKEFMVNYLSNVASEWLEGERKIQEDERREAEAQEKAKRIKQERQEMNDLRAKQDSKVEISTDQYVDLGLSVYWGGYNLGASSPEEYGGWYLWGETGNKGRQGAFTSVYHAIDSQTYANVYSKNIELTYRDAAKSLGEGWSTPTQRQFEELSARCKIYQTTYNGVLGFKVVGPSGKAIFLPAGGKLSYLLSSYKMYKSEVAGSFIPDVDAGACINANAKKMLFELGSTDRDFTGVIRPVKTKK